MVITTPAAFPLVLSRIHAISAHALDWYATARCTNQFAKAIFTYSLDSLVDAQLSELFVDQTTIPYFSFHKKLTQQRTICIQCKESFAQTSSLLMDDLAAKLFTVIQENCPQIIQDLTLKVELVNIQDEIINANSWSFQSPIPVAQSPEK